MENIEFKAKMVDGGVWVYGSYTAMREDDHNECFRTKPHKIYHRIWQWESGDWNMGGYANYEVIPETVCQWTILFDKNRTKLYDGDKFQYRKHDGYFLGDFVGVVKFKDGCFGFTVIGEASTGYFVPFSKFDELQEDFLDHIEIIGNIHDKAHQKQAIIDMMRGDEELGLYDD